MPEFNAQEISVVIDGETVAHLDAIGYDQEKDHELQRSLDEDGNVWVIGTGEYSGTVAVKAVSESIPRLEEIFQNNESFALSVSYTPDEPRDSSQFTDAKLTSFGPADDYEESGMPMYEGEWEASKVEHNNGS